MLLTSCCTLRSLVLVSAVAAVLTAQAVAGTLRVGAGLFQPAQATPLQWEDTELRAETRRDNETILLTLKVAGAPARSLALPDELQQVTALRRHGERLIVIGWMNSALASMVLLVDWRLGQVVDQFWAYAPSVSPDGSMVAFERFYPSHGVQGEESQYRLYRTTEPPQANRLTLSPNGSALRDAGLAAWPSDTVNGPRPNTGVAATRAHHRLSPLVWSADSSRFAVVDGRGTEAQVLLVMPGTLSVVQRHLISAPEALCLSAGRVPKGCPMVPTEAVALRHLADAVELVVDLGTSSAQARRLRLPLGGFSPVDR